MKNFNINTFLTALLMLSSILLNSTDANACIDPDTVITTTVNFSEDFTEIEIRLGNLKLHTETPNTFCSCALSGYEEAFTNPNYIAFVYAGTNTLFDNFDNWNNTPGADDAWNSEFSNYPDWTGFISEVINLGLSTDDEVEMVIRVSTAPGTYVVPSDLDSTISLLTLGTDMWLPGEQTMAFDHPGIRNLRWDNSSFVMNPVPMEYFEQLDNGVLSSDNEILESMFNLEVFPNPVADEFWVDIDLPAQSLVSITVHDISGKRIANIMHQNLPGGKQRLPFNATAILPKQGVYLLEIQIGGVKGVRKIIK